ncbi:delta-12 fatty acid desaturase [Coprinellus micaceus]|uniref:Delta-12 fatty acid desaturase n=1 Tax=Coprinellus micaceus TaxID=71717 RepID=A0A4Y7SRQ4_COPMI|nr:delta-12 fatty acid desaturase [Coprinellus micaceus]
MSSIFQDSPEYVRRTKTPFKPPQVTLAEVRAAVPKHLFQKSTFRGLLFVFRDIVLVLVLYELAHRIGPFIKAYRQISLLVPFLLRPLLWCAYWLFQSLTFAGCWCLAHEAGHGTLVSISWLNHVIGFTFHTALLVPYYAWRSTHQAHHKATGSLERDENYLPKTRSDYGLPAERITHLADYHEIFEETPVYTFLRMFAMQMIGWQWYLATNIQGNPAYPSGTNHFKPSSALFKPHERMKIVASNVGLAIVILLLSIWTRHVGFSNFFCFYFVPYLLTNHWIVMLTFLHHSDPTLPHYRGKAWSFVRGAVATVDRPLLGWMGRFFLHNVSHDHVAHHLFSNVPFYNQPYVTEAIKAVLKDDYNYDSTNSFRALYRSFSQCCFIEDDGDIVFYKNKDGRPLRVLECDAVKRPSVD